MPSARLFTLLQPSAGPRLRLPREGLCWLLITLVLLVISWLRAINLLLLLAYLMVLLWLVNFFLAGRRLHQLQAKRRIDGPVFAQTPFTHHLEVVHHGKRPQFGLRLVDNQAPAFSACCFLPQLGSGACVRWVEQVQLPQRGRYRLAGLAAVSGYPFGLVERRADIGGAEEIRVLPRLGRLQLDRLRRFLRQTASAAEGGHCVARPECRVPAEFHGIRPFQAGDSPRWIHWRSSARQGELMVREFDTVACENLVLVVDLHVPSDGVPEEHGSAGTSPSQLLEDTISLAATICWQWCQRRDNRLLLAVAGPNPLVLHERASPEYAVRLLECLADVQGQAESGWEALCALLPADVLPAGPVLVVGSQAVAWTDALADHWRRPVVQIHADALERLDFYERPSPHGA